jgi:hypothetical protein
MRRITITAALAAAAVLALAGTASADVGDIDRLSIDEEFTGTAETVEASGDIRCTSSIEYGLVAGVEQPNNSGFFFFYNADTGQPVGDAQNEAVGAFGPNQGNQDNSPCSTNIQDWDLVLQRNRDSGTFDTGAMGVFLTAGTSAEGGSRGPGPFIGDLGFTFDDVNFTRSDP